MWRSRPQFALLRFSRHSPNCCRSSSISRTADTTSPYHRLPASSPIYASIPVLDRGLSPRSKARAPLSAFTLSKLRSPTTHAPAITCCLMTSCTSVWLLHRAMKGVLPLQRPAFAKHRQWLLVAGHPRGNGVCVCPF